MTLEVYGHLFAKGDDRVEPAAASSALLAQQMKPVLGLFRCLCLALII
jgi:hypothetical protein